MIISVEKKIEADVEFIYATLCCKYVFSAATYMSALKAQYLLREPIDPLIFSNLFEGKMSINKINSILKLFR